MRWASLAILASAAVSLSAADWPQFRGPNASGVAPDNSQIPAQIDLSTDLIWKTPVGAGHSSPVIVDGKLFLTAFEDAKLWTLAFDSTKGSPLWKQEAPHEKLEEHHRRSSPAVASAACDGRRVVSFFGSCGLFCYDTSGRLLWRLPLGPFNDPQGAASSPIIAGDRIVMVHDQDNGSHMAAYRLSDGSEIWRAERSAFRRNYGTPVLWNNAGRTEVVTAGSSLITGYDLSNGTLVWSVVGCARVVSATPVVGADGGLYVVNAGGGGDLRGRNQPAFGSLLESSDKNANGKLEKKELPKGPIAGFIDQFDRNADGALDEEEYESIRRIYQSVRHVAMAIRPGGKGDITDTHVAWTQDRMIPRNASPVVYKNHLFMVRDGGILTSLNLSDGSIAKTGRLTDAGGSYFSSPVAAGGRIYLLNDRGTLTTVAAEGDWKQVGSTRFDEECFATPAIVDGRIYVRTAKAMYCLGRR